MDPTFVERHWHDLPHLNHLRAQGAFAPLATTIPPQSPVAWSTFITGLDPAGHGIFDFVHRNPNTHELYLSTDKTIEPRFNLPLGPYELPLGHSRVESLRRGEAFWQTLAEHGIPVTIVRIPSNYPPLAYGKELAGMGTPDLRGTQGTFTFFTNDVLETSHAVPGGLIRRTGMSSGHTDLTLEGPPNPLRRDHAYASVTLTLDVDPQRPVARLQLGERLTVIQQGEWSDWLTADFPLLPHVVSVRGMFRVFAKQLHPLVELYVSPINIDPQTPALPISAPPSFARGMGRFYTLGIAEDTSALRQGVFDMPEFLAQSRLVLRDERKLLDDSLADYREGFLFFYFSTVDQNSHMLFGKHDDELLEFYRNVDDAIGEVMRLQPDADLIVMSDHGFSTFDRAVNLNTWLLEQGLLTVDRKGAIDWARTKAYAVGLNAFYLSGADRNDVRERLLALRDNGRAPIEAVTDVHAAPTGPDLVIGYAPGYRASWGAAVGEVEDQVFADNTDAWIADHCIDAAAVPGVLFTSRGIAAGPNPSLKTLSGTILRLYGQAR